MKKKLAFVDLTNFVNWPMGGMLQYELNILPYLCRKYKVDIWGVSVDGKFPKSIIINNKDYPVYIWANAKTNKRLLPNYLKGLFLCRFKKFFEKYDIIYAHTATCLFPFFSLEKRGIKVVYHQHGLMYLKDKSLKTRIQKPFMKKAQEKSNIVFIVSGIRSVKAYKKKIHPKGKLVSINSPIKINSYNEKSLQHKLNKKRKPDKFIYTGRLTRFKNVASLVPIFKKYVDNVNSKAQLTIIGNGEEFYLIKSLVKKYNLKENIMLTGEIPHSEIKKYLYKNDIFLMPSKGEGVSVSVAEANSFGLPVICFNVPGLEEQVIAGVNGYLALKNNNLDFYKKLLRVTYHWKELVSSSFAYSKNYKSSKIAKLIINNIENDE